MNRRIIQVVEWLPCLGNFLVFVAAILAVLALVVQRSEDKIEDQLKNSFKLYLSARIIAIIGSFINFFAVTFLKINDAFSSEDPQLPPPILQIHIVILGILGIQRDNSNYT
jgi:hypothetical protein